MIRGRGSRRRRRVRALWLALIALACLGPGFFAGACFERFLQVDRCLDAGGRFDYERSLCER